MRFIVIILFMMSSFLLSPYTLAQATDDETAGWNTYHSDKGEYSFRYPSPPALGAPHADSGQTCINRKCQPIESISLGGFTDSSKTTIGEVGFQIQRNMNPEHLPMDKLFENFTHKPLGPNAKLVSIGGKTALCLGPDTPALKATIPLDGKPHTVTANDKDPAAKGVSGIYSYFIPLNASDVLSTHCGASDSIFDHNCRAIISTITIP